jgi:hypothetical protein
MIEVFAFLRRSLKDTGTAGTIRPLSTPHVPAFAVGSGLRRGSHGRTGRRLSDVPFPWRRAPLRAGAVRSRERLSRRTF